MYEIADNHFPSRNEGLDEKEEILNLELEGFSGPLDLLLTLATNKKLDITKISILSLVDQYLEFIKKIKKLNLDLASDYLVMAAVLAYIKSKLLIPDNNINDKNASDLPEILEFNLKRLNAIRKNTEKLFSRELLYDKRFLKGQIQDKAILLEKEYYCSKKSLIICFANIYNRKNPTPSTFREGNYYSIELALKKIRDIYKHLSGWANLKVFLPKEEEIGTKQNSLRIAFISTIAASLELVKNGEIYIKQDKEFGEVLIKKRSIDDSG